MNFHNMQRKKLQKLCKKHKFPAHLTNKLSSLFEIEEKQGRPCLQKCPTEKEDKNNGVEKKVRFSPKNEVFEHGDYKKVEHYELIRQV